MPHNIPWTVRVQPHPGSTADEIRNEPNWTADHQHRVGFRDRNDRLPGITHQDDESHSDDIKQEKERYLKLKKKAKSGELVNFRDIIENQEVERNSLTDHGNNKLIGYL